MRTVPFLCGSMNVESCDNGIVPAKPHKANDAAWEAIGSVRRRDGSVGLKHFKMLRRLGSGDIGNVFLCQLRGCGNCFFAMKVVNREALSFKKKLHRADMEKDILCMLDHPFLPTLYAHFHASHYSCSVIDYCPGGDLHSLRHRQPAKRFTLRSARFYAAEVLVGLEYLHMMGVIYRDLKPENVLVRGDGHIMLSDFDLSFTCDVVPTVDVINASRREGKYPHHMSRVHTAASPCNGNSTGTPPPSPTKPTATCIPNPILQLRRWLSKEEAKRQISGGVVAEPSEVRSRSFVGTHEYVAPEVTSGEGHGSAVDWWSFGVFVFELLYGTTPFKGSNNDTTLLNIISQPLNFPYNPTRDSHAWAAAKDLISRLLAKDPRSRLGSNRGSADIKTHPFFTDINWALIRCTVPPEIPGLVRTTSSYHKKTFLSSSSSSSSHFDYF